MYYRMPICSKCQVEKEKSEFYLRNKSKNLVTSFCKACANKDCRERAQRKRLLNPKRLGGQRRYRLDETIFQKIESEEQAYWLGFLYADGYNGESKGMIRLGLAEIDALHIDKFKTFLKSNSPCKIYPPRRLREQPMHVVDINSTKLSKDLSAVGCMQAKTFKIRFPHWLDKSLHKHFIRGYFDGDGSVGKYINNRNSVNCSASIVSNIDFLKDIQTIIKNESAVNFSLSKTFNKNRTSVRALYSSGNIQILKFLHWMYNESNVYLERKYNKYLEIKNYIINRPPKRNQKEWYCQG